jgi:hypothetical protein
VRQLILLITVGKVPVAPIMPVLAGAFVVVVLVVVVDVVVVPGTMVVPVVAVVRIALQPVPFQVNPVIHTQEVIPLLTPTLFRMNEQLR